jgi:di/tricarboxylate transporter
MLASHMRFSRVSCSGWLARLLRCEGESSTYRSWTGGSWLYPRELSLQRWQYANGFRRSTFEIRWLDHHCLLLRPLNMTWEAWFTVVLVLGILVALIKNWSAPDILFLTAVVLLTAVGIITPTEAFAGFSNTGMLTVAFLFVVVAGLRETGLLDLLGQRVLGGARTEASLLGRLSLVVMPLSAFLNNTPIVAMFVAALACIYILGSLVTELITNNAAAVLMFPFCLETAKLYDASPLPFVIALMLAASASFMTPVGYQTNMMVYGPGGYQFSDFLKIGAPLNAMLAVVAVTLIPYFWPFY